jgi:hypothetical protein
MKIFNIHRFIFNTVTIFIFASLMSCSGIPKGTMILKDEYNRDLDKAFTMRDKFNGKPIYVEVQTYPQLTAEGHIIQGSQELIRIGHEEISLKKTIDDFYKKKAAQRNE